MRGHHEIEDWFSPGGPKVPPFWMPFLSVVGVIIVLIIIWGICV